MLQIMLALIIFINKLKLQEWVSKRSTMIFETLINFSEEKFLYH